MRLEFIFLFTLTVFISCTKTSTRSTENDNLEYYVVKTIDSSFYKSHPNTPFVDFYGDLNILLIDSLKEIYFHKKRWLCMTGSQEKNILPHFRFLKPEYFEKTSNLNTIIDSVMAFKSDLDYPTFVYISTNNDTIYDKRYFELKQQFIKKKISVGTRKITEEESNIIISILKHKEYDPIEIIWKSTIDVPDKETMKLLNSDTF